MTGPTEAIAEALRRHRFYRPNRGCLCGWEIDASDPMNPTHFEQHLAQAVVAALTANRWALIKPAEVINQLRCAEHNVYANVGPSPVLVAIRDAIAILTAAGVGHQPSQEGRDE